MRRIIIGAVLWTIFWLITAMAVAAVLLGCGVATQQGRRAQASAQVVAQHRIYQVYSDWQRSPWYRPSDLYSITPVSLLISEGGYGCIVEPGDWVMAQERVRYACESGWRAPRPRREDR